MPLCLQANYKKNSVRNFASYGARNRDLKIVHFTLIMGKSTLFNVNIFKIAKRSQEKNNFIYSKLKNSYIIIVNILTQCLSIETVLMANYLRSN